MEDRILALGEAAWDVLRRMLRELAARRPGGHLVEAHLDEIQLRLSLSLRGSADGPRRFAGQLAEALEQALDDAVEREAAFRPGHTYCHRCRAAACEHSRPPGNRHVFVGYAPTGAPRWEDFAQYCLDRRHPDVDRLYGGRPALLATVQTGAELRAGLLEAFHSETYELLGQVTAGFFMVPAPLEEGRGVVAITLQVAASRPSRGRGRGRTRLGLNILGRAPSGEELATLWDRQRELPWRRPVRWAQAALRSLRIPAGAAAWGDAESPAARRVERILHGLARRLERGVRARDRRTLHADERHESGARPTRKAIDDARAASDEAVLVDERAKTLVVLGDRGRTHFFTSDGRLVSSVRYSRDAIARKRKLGLWREASEAEARGLRDKVADAG